MMYQLELICLEFDQKNIIMFGGYFIFKILLRN